MYLTEYLINVDANIEVPSKIRFIKMARSKPGKISLTLLLLPFILRKARLCVLFLLSGKKVSDQLIL